MPEQTVLDRLEAEIAARSVFLRLDELRALCEVARAAQSLHDYWMEEAMGSAPVIPLWEALAPLLAPVEGGDG